MLNLVTQYNRLTVCTAVIVTTAILIVSVNLQAAYADSGSSRLAIIHAKGIKHYETLRETISKRFKK